MRCFICDKDCTDGEIILIRINGKVSFSPCLECREIIKDTNKEDFVTKEENKRIVSKDFDR